MPGELAPVFAPSPLWRVERTDPALRLSLLNPVDVMNDRAGNRIDIPDAGVLYGATKADGGFAETLSGLNASSIYGPGWTAETGPTRHIHRLKSSTNKYPLPVVMEPLERVRFEWRKGRVAIDQNKLGCPALGGVWGSPIPLVL